MTKPLDPDIKALKGAVRALQHSSSRRMLKANMDYLWHRFINNAEQGDLLIEREEERR